MCAQFTQDLDSRGSHTFTWHLAFKGDVKVILAVEVQQPLHVTFELIHTSLAHLHLQPVGLAMELDAHEWGNWPHNAAAVLRLEGLPPVRQRLIAEPAAELLRLSKQEHARFHKG